MGGEDVKKLRNGLKLSRAEFASQFGISKETVRQWACGRRFPSEAARVLISVIANSPEAVRKVVGATSAI